MPSEGKPTVWDSIGIVFTMKGDEVDSLVFETVPGDDKDSGRLGEHYRRYFRFTGPESSHDELLAVLREDGWEPFAIWKDTHPDNGAERMHRWFKRPSEPPLPSAPKDWNDVE